jgi:hypothetical protein
VKKSSAFEWLKQSKRVARMWKMIKEVVVQDLTELMKMLHKGRI